MSYRVYSLSLIHIYLSNFCFAVCDEKFPERCRKEGPSIVIGGSNYGQGSSREHAALVPLYLGVKAVVAKSFARIHCANLANAGILPFTFKNEADYDTIDQMDELELPNIRTAIANGGKVILKNKTKGTEIELEPVLTERQRDLVLAGGLLNYTRAVSYTHLLVPITFRLRPYPKWYGSQSGKKPQMQYGLEYSL